jgi:hypothetical protein
LIADYDRRNFSVSQCKWVQDSQQDIIAILPPTNATANSTTSVPHQQTPAHKSSLFTIAGAIIAAVLTIISLVSLLIHFKIIKPRRQKRKLNSKPKPILEPGQEIGSSREKLGYLPGNIETDGRPIYEVAEEGGSSGALVLAEADGREFHRHEMAANEDVAVEMMGFGAVPELDGNEEFNDLWLGQRFQSPINSAVER